MHKSFVRIAQRAFNLSLIIITLLALPATAKADAIFGCPLGLPKGKLWLKKTFSCVKASQVYALQDTNSNPQMIPLNDSTHMQKQSIKIRIGYGVTNWFDVGVFIPYVIKDMEFYGYKSSPVNGKIVSKHKIVKTSGFEDIWFSGKIKLLGHHSLLHPSDKGWLESIALATAYKPPTAGDDQVCRGLGSGSHDVKVGLLVHNKVAENLHMCSHFTYQYTGKVRDIYMRNHITGGPYPGVPKVQLWPKSGWNLGDKITYKLAFEYELGKYFAVAIAANGWMHFKDIDNMGITKKGSTRYQHAVTPKVEFAPFGDKRSHTKLVMGIKIPYIYKTDFHAPFIPMLTTMWTF